MDLAAAGMNSLSISSLWSLSGPPVFLSPKFLAPSRLGSCTFYQYQAQHAGTYCAPGLNKQTTVTPSSTKGNNRLITSAVRRPLPRYISSLPETFLPASWHAIRGSGKIGKSYLYTLMARRLYGLRGGRLGSGNFDTATEAAGVTESGFFSLSDATLSQKGLELSRETEDLDLDQLNSLFAKVGFPTRDKAKLSVALDHTLSLLWLRETSSSQLVAFARATGDAVFNAIIWDVVVDPKYHGVGLGKAIMERLMADLVSKGISNIALYAEPNVVGFYRPLGFVTDPVGIRGMAYNRRRR